MIQAGRYHAIVSNSAGSTSSLVALLTTQPLFLPPIIQIQPVSQTATEGESVQFRVDARGNGPLKYQWLHEGANLPQATNATLRLAKLNAGQSGRYLVVVSNGGKSTNSETAILTVKRRAIAPTLTGQPQSQSVAEGTNVLFAAEAQGSTPLFYQWSHNGRSLPGQTNAQLQLLAVTTNDAGIYAIEVRNEAGAARSAEAALTLVAPAGAAGADSKSLDAVLENYEVLLRITKPPKGSSDSALPRGRIPLDRFNDYLARFDDLQRRYDQGGWLDANRRARLQNLREKLKEWR
ncbi:MAG: immunoglobulin domain-containing protein [Verrucomicrobiota bacterium]